MTLSTKDTLVERQAIRIYWFASFLAVIEAFFLFILGLDLRFEQVTLFFVLGVPAAAIMLLCDHWLIIRHTRPIDTILSATETGQKPARATVQGAYYQLLNLPMLTLLRVLVVHAPSILVPLTVLCLLANRVANFGLAWWQFLVLWSFWPITAVPHAIVEYFLIDRSVCQTLRRLDSLYDAPMIAVVPGASVAEALRLLLGLPTAIPQLIRTSTGMQLAWLIFFVSLSPLFVLGTSVYLKLSAFNTPVAAEQVLAVLGPWLIFLIGLNTAISVAIVTLMSRRVRSAMQALLGNMQRVLAGDFSQPWHPQTTDEFFDLGLGFNTMLLGLREREKIKDTFGRFVSQEVATAVLEDRIPLHGELREVSILFQDIRGFTSLSERTAPAALLQFINTFFTDMVAAVESQSGVVKQFTGDGVMALFGAPASRPDDPVRAVRAALNMLARLEALNRQRQARGDAALRIGIGIHTGEVVAGCIGPDLRVEYGVVGDAVNLASRVQDLTKEVGVPLLITEATAARLGNAFAFGRHAVLPVRGKAQPITVIEVVHERIPGRNPTDPACEPLPHQTKKTKE
jgi:class 3 adenylate cyclase